MKAHPGAVDAFDLPCDTFLRYLAIDSFLLGLLDGIQAGVIGDVEGDPLAVAPAPGEVHLVARPEHLRSRPARAPVLARRTDAKRQLTLLERLAACQHAGAERRAVRRSGADFPDVAVPLHLAEFVLEVDQVAARMAVI